MRWDTNDALGPLPTFQVPVIELMRVWGELVEAYHGVNGYGGDTAEVYAYRLMGRNPAAEASSTGYRSGGAVRKQERVARLAFAQLCTAFELEYGCEVRIDDHKPEDWVMVTRFDHRAHVKVVRGGS